VGIWERLLLLEPKLICEGSCCNFSCFFEFDDGCFYFLPIDSLMSFGLFTAERRNGGLAGVLFVAFFYCLELSVIKSLRLIALVGVGDPGFSRISGTFYGELGLLKTRLNFSVRFYLN